VSYFAFGALLVAVGLIGILSVGIIARLELGRIGLKVAKNGYVSGYSQGIGVFGMPPKEQICGGLVCEILSMYPAHHAKEGSSSFAKVDFQLLIFPRVQRERFLVGQVF
jgi:hypothetical protein